MDLDRIRDGPLGCGSFRHDHAAWENKVGVEIRVDDSYHICVHRGNSSVDCRQFLGLDVGLHQFT